MELGSVVSFFNLALDLSLNILNIYLTFSHFSVIHQPTPARGFPFPYLTECHLSKKSPVVGSTLQLEGVETTTSMANTTESVEHLTVVTCSDLGIDSDRMKQSEAGENRQKSDQTRGGGGVTKISVVSWNLPNIFAKIHV